MRYLIPLVLCAVLSWIALSPAPAQEASDEEPVRLANGVVMEGAIKKAAPEGLTIETPKGVMTLPWKYLSAGTRYRHERPMLEAVKKAEEAKKKAAEKAAKAAEAKAAAEAAKKAAGTNAAPAVPSAAKKAAPAAK